MGKSSALLVSCFQRKSPKQPFVRPKGLYETAISKRSYHPSYYDSLASNELRGRALHQWTKEAKNVPQVNNDGGKDEWIGPSLLAVHRCISVSVKETIDAFASKQPRRMKLSFILEDEATDATDE